MSVVGRIFGGIVGLLFGVAAGLLLAPAAAAFMSADNQNSVGVMWMVVLAGVLLGVFAPTIRRAFGRGFLLLGVAFVALPISVLLLSGRVGSEMIAGAGNDGDAAAAAIGSGIAGVMATGAATFIGFIGGAICIVIGLVLALGGRREVYVVQR
jgi:hypothetical protein